MCLYLTKRDPIVAQEDIVCYKVLIVKKVSVVGLDFRYDFRRPPFHTEPLKYRFFAPFTNYEYHLGRILLADENVTIQSNDCMTFFPYSISGGVFHTFKKLDDAKEVVKHGESFVIVKCIIPKGSIYYQGYFMLDKGRCESYGSQVLRVTNEIML